MNFPEEPTRVPTAIGPINVTLRDDGDGGQAVDYQIMVEYNNGDPKTLRGNLVPYLTAQEISQLQSFMATLRTRAEQQILP